MVLTKKSSIADQSSITLLLEFLFFYQDRYPFDWTWSPSYHRVSNSSNVMITCLWTLETHRLSNCPFVPLSECPCVRLPGQPAFNRLKCFVEQSRVWLRWLYLLIYSQRYPAKIWTWGALVGVTVNPPQLPPIDRLSENPWQFVTLDRVTLRLMAIVAYSDYDSDSACPFRGFNLRDPHTRLGSVVTN